MENKNIYFVKGYEIRHSMHFGSGVSKTETEYICGICDYQIEKFAEYNNTKQGVRFSPTLNLATNELSLYDTWIYVTEYRVATRKELNTFAKVLAKHNLVFSRRTLKRWERPLGCHEPYETSFELLAPYYISKDDMRINIDGGMTTYKELKEVGFADGEKVILSGDNGYSHCWASTTQAQEVFNMIEDIFAIPTDMRRFETRRQCRAYVGENYGWKFGKCGELIVRITKNNIRFSEVSNS